MPVRTASLLVLTALLAATSASGQVRPGEAAPPTTGQRVLVVVGGALGGVAAVAGTYQALYPASDTRAGVALVAASYPAGVAVGVLLSGEALGLDVPVDAVLADAVVGVPIGVAAGAAVGLVIGGVTYALSGPSDYNFVPVLLGGGVGVLTVLGVSTAWASRRFRAEPVALAGPAGERAVGLRLSVGL